MMDLNGNCTMTKTDGDRVEVECSDQASGLQYSKPTLTKMGAFGDVVQSSPLPGSDGTGGFPTDSGS